MAKLISIILLTSACGIINIKQPFGSKSGGQTSSGDAAQPSSGGGKQAAPAQKETVKLVVDAKLANPKTLPAVIRTTNTSPNKLGFDCGGHMGSSPIAILDVKASTKLNIRAKGPGSLAVKIGNSVVCKETATRSETAEILLEKWPAGVAEVYIGDVGSNMNITAALVIEDLARPADLDWSAATKLSLDGAPKQPLYAHTSTAGKTREDGPRVGGCADEVRAIPDAVLDIAAPITSLQISGRSVDAEQVILIGPVPPDHRRIPVQCQNGSRGSFSVEPGTYGVKIADKGRATFVNVVVAAKDAKTAQDTTLAPVVPEKLGLSERDVTLHFPSLTAEEILRSDVVRWALFATAPRQLFAYVARDLTSDTAGALYYPGDGGDAKRWPGSDEPAIDYPKASEPVLIIGEKRILTADGAAFWVSDKTLVETPAGALAFPEGARVRSASLGQLESNAGKEDAASLKTHESARKKYDQCSMKIEGPVADKMLAMQANGLTASEEQQIYAMQQTTRKKVEAACNPQGLMKLRDATWAKLIATRTARRDKALAAARARFAGDK
jgi:hypothetical protein